MKPVSLALGGGGVRGFAHLGALEVFLGAGVQVAALAGSSAGALAAAAFAFGLSLKPDLYLAALTDPRLLKLMGEETGSFQRIRRLPGQVFAALRNPSLASNEPFREGLLRIFGERDLLQSPIPLGIVAADLITGEMVVLREGLLVDALLASSALPGIFPPILWGGRLLVDGAIAEKTPVTAAKELAEAPVLALDISNPPEEIPKTQSALDVLLRASEASRNRLQALALAQADWVLSLQPEQHINTFAYQRTSELFALGQVRARDFLPSLLGDLQTGSSRRSWLGRIFSVFESRPAKP